MSSRSEPSSPRSGRGRGRGGGADGHAGPRKSRPPRPNQESAARRLRVISLGPRLEQLTIGAAPGTWAAAGFTVAGDQAAVGTVRVRFEAGEGLTGWRLEGVPAPEIDGLPVSAEPSADAAAGEPHPNGVTRIDHLVVFTPDLERTTAALEQAGIGLRRVREVEAGGIPLRQGFLRLGEVILEVVEQADVAPGPARFWGITFEVADLEAATRLLGDRLGSIRDAVQPGRRIATVRREAGLGLPAAMITPGPGRREDARSRRKPERPSGSPG